jgi:peptide/nickel transport system permease protein
MAVQVPDLAAVPAVRLAEPGERRSRLGALVANLDIYVPSLVLAVIVLGCFLGPALFHLQSPVKGSLLETNLPPLSPGHLLGTDQLGNDELSRSLFGGRISIEVGLGSVLAGMLVGGFFGTVAGYFGSGVETVIMRVLDVFLAFPALVLAMTIATYLGQSERNVIIAIAFFTVPAFGRLARATTLRVREMDYVTAGKLSGRPAAAIMLRHIVPNIVPQLMTFGLLTVAAAMLIEAALSYLGLGVPPPTPTWGGMISAGQGAMETEPWLVLVPGAFLFVTVLALNRLGDALRVRWATK